MAAAMKTTSSSLAASCSRQGSLVPCVRASPTSRGQRHVARIAEPAAMPAVGGPEAAADAFQQRAGGFKKEYKPLTPEDLSSNPIDPDSLKLPAGYHWYETMIVLRPTISDQERDELLAKFEAYLNTEECQRINVLVRSRSRLAYPMKKFWDGMYVLYTYAAKRQTARNVQHLLSNPEAGREDDVLRHITFCRL